MAELKTDPEREHLLTKNVEVSHEETLYIPSEWLTKTTGFALDIGGSMVKIAYATDEGASVRLHFVSYPRRQIEDVIVFLEKTFGDTLIKDCTINTCGVGFQQYQQQIEDRLSVKLNVLNEMDCFTEGYRFLIEKQYASELFHDESPEVQKYTAILLKTTEEAMNMAEKYSEDGKMQMWEVADETNDLSNGEPDNRRDDLETKTTNPQNEVTNDDDQYPVLMAMLGSGAATMLLEKDGTHRLLEGNTRCGRMFLGLGRILTGAETFEELIDLAARGDSQSLNVCGKHLKTGFGDNIYSHLPDDTILYSFGLGTVVKPDSVSREDLAATLLSSICQDLAQTVHLSAMVYNVKQMVFCGSFPGSSQVVRDEIGKHLGFRCMINSQGVKYEYHFLKYGGYFGAFGALLRTLKGESRDEQTQL